MKRYNFFAIAFFAAFLLSCEEENDNASVVDPRYAEMTNVSSITPTSATFSLKLKQPVSKVDDGYMVDGMYFDDYMFFYSSDPDASLRLWKRIESRVNDESGSYSLVATDLAPATRYYVKAGVIIAPRNTQVSSWSISASVLEFETAR